jgi:CheY-like chemotaxis protein
MDAVGQLAAGVAHDFNNLLTIILGNCEIAEPLVAGQDRLQHTVDDIRTAAERAAALTKQLLAFSRRQIIRPRVLDLNEVVAEIRRMVTRLIGEDIDVRFSPGAELWHVSADSGQLQQVIVNLAVNARDAMPQGGCLTIETRNVRYDQPHVESRAKVPRGEYVLLSVTDTGVGMDDATHEHMYEPFFTTKDPGKGTGLGLATVYGIVKQSGGFIFSNSRPGAGTTFRMLLPRADTAMEPAHTELPRPQVVTGSETLLLVEDERDVRELLREFLAAKGYDVMCAGTGNEGIELCRTRAVKPDMLVTDIVMPGMNGRALADRLRAVYPGLKVLYMSGYTDDALVRDGPLPTGTHFLQKPFVLATLAKKVREIIDGTVD